jgi:nucleotidyltransferase substrate binding protein (TIGR01987 family)
MKLDLTSLKQAIAQLTEGLRLASQEPGSDLLRDGVIQRFEYTYEVSWKSLKRFLENTSSDPQAIDTLAFADLIRLGHERGLLRSSYDVWAVFRKARGTTSHTYDQKKAEEVYQTVPDFLEEARFLLERLQSYSS